MCSCAIGTCENSNNIIQTCAPTFLPSLQPHLTSQMSHSGRINTLDSGPLLPSRFSESYNPDSRRTSHTNIDSRRTSHTNISTIEPLPFARASTSTQLHRPASQQQGYSRCVCVCVCKSCERMNLLICACVVAVSDLREQHPCLNPFKRILSSQALSIFITCH